MMNRYSQLIAPFCRTTSDPLEVDYRFNSVDNLKVWATKNAGILHAGLLKIVEDKDTKEFSFYTFKEVPTDSDIQVGPRPFELVKLFSIRDVNDISAELEKINEQIKAIWGVNDPENIDEKYNSILKIAEKLAYLNEKIKELTRLDQTDKAIIGYTGDDLIEYLTTLKYNSITVINNALDDFWNKNSDKGQAINTWMDLKDFLAGYTNDQTLKDVLLEITGGKLDFVDSDTVGVEVLPLKDRIQVKHSVKLGTGVTDHDLDIKDENFIIIKNGGLFYNLYITDTGKALQFKCNGSIVHIFEYSDIIDQKIEEQTEGLIDIKDVYYDQANEQIVIIFSTRSGDKIVRIPMSIVIREWETVNIPGEPVKLELTPAAGDGKDKLKAILQVSTDEKNLVQKKMNGLYVSGDSKLMYHGDSSLSDTIESLKTKDSELTEKIVEQGTLFDDKLNAYKEEVNHTFDDKDAILEQKIKDVNKAIEDESLETNQRITDEVRGLNDTIAETNKNVAHNKVDIENKLIEAVTGITDRINLEVEGLNGRIDNEVLAINTDIDKEVSVINARIDSEVSTINTRIDTEVGTLNDTITANKDSIEAALSTHSEEADKRFTTDEAAIAENKAAIEALDTKTADDKVELETLIQETDKKLQKNIDDFYDVLNNDIQKNRTEVDARIDEVKASLEGSISDTDTKFTEALDEAKAELNTTITETKTELEASIDSLRTDVMDAIKALEEKMVQDIADAITAHVNENHTWVEASK